MLGGDPFPDALIDLSQRGRHSVELALARLRLFALGSHTSPSIKRILGLLRRDPELGINCVPTVHRRLLTRAIIARTQDNGNRLEGSFFGLSS